MPVIAELPGGRQVVLTEGEFDETPDAPAPEGNYMYVAEELIVHQAHEDACRARLQGDLTSREVPGSDYVLIQGLTGDIPELVDTLSGEDLDVTPHHVLPLANHVEFGPDDAPRPVRQSDTDYDDARAQTIMDAPGSAPLVEPRPFVVAIDTGILPSDYRIRSEAILRGSDEDPLMASDLAGEIPPYFGHGTAVAGSIIAQAPQARVLVVRPVDFTPAPNRGWMVVSDEGLAKALVRALPKVDADPDSRKVLNLSLAGPVHGRPDEPLPFTAAALGGWIERGFQIVAAAGNNHRKDEHYPAAFDYVSGVAALDGTGIAGFSNCGDWVSYCAPGKDVFTCWIKGGTANTTVRVRGGSSRREMTMGPWEGFVRWSGTSFAAPYVAGQFAAGMVPTQCPRDPRCP